ncbi:SusC/RagA family TonB-linked outer membrane protein [Dyadobacter sp. CY323]|uniref:SusC/RagA family TonB-linked outer membrane protein n=1 Tax=Dyadobacter sp. CY323 TaxID=2907302 RepID=UPI001F44C05A|nr:SusC/RagA family TonB-linked outer membrane protein [Dyadobacter sp. CY323]MCE6988092.1 SusC/RagA family TonB-linked outer membrane protein [Dyadobacter sp. CY323]
MARTLLLLLFFMSAGLKLFAEKTASPASLSSKTRHKQLVVKGKVLDETGAALPGASVTVKGTTTGVLSDASGDFQITVTDESAVLTISFIGYRIKEVPVSQEFMTVQLTPDATQLDQVVVTALGISRKTKALTYATQKVEPKQLNEVRDANNLLNSFQGKIVNALITQSSGGVGSDARVVLRGNSSIAGENGALVVVDGVPNSSITSINPDDIESVNVLRGAAAAALYGSQAGNGVIVITTKRGTSGKATVNVNTGVTVETPFALPFFQNTYGQGNLGVLNPSIGDSWGARMEGQEYTNIQGNPRSYTAQPNNVRDFFTTGVNNHNSISVAGGTDRVQNYLSYTNSNVSGIIPKNKLSNHNINLRMTNQLGKRLTVDSKITYFSQKIDARPRYGEGNKPVFDIYQIPRNYSTEDAQNYATTNSVGVLTPAAWPTTANRVYGNPYWVVNHDILDIYTNKVVGFLSAKYALTPWLNITGRANLDKVFEKQERRTSQDTWQWANKPGGYFSVAESKSTQQWYEAILDGNNKLGSDFTVSYNFGAIYQDRAFDQITNVADGLNVANKFSLLLATNPVMTPSGWHIRTQSIFGQASFSYKDALFLEGSLRNDWDSRLPAPHSFQYFSLGGSAVVSDLITMPKAISFLKASLNYAEVGNGGQFGLLVPSYRYTPGAGNGYLTRNTTLPLPGLKPEIVQSQEATVEAKFYGNRLGFTATYYKSNSKNQLLSISVPNATGYSRQYINAGNIQNRGLEFVLNATPLKTSGFDWNIDLNFGLNRNKVISLTDQLKVVYLGGHLDFGAQPQIMVGGSYGDIISYQWKRDNSGNYVVNANGTPMTTRVSGDQPGVIGNFNPKANMGITNTFNYKGFSLRALVDGRFGGILVSGTEQNIAFSGLTEGTLPYREGGWDLKGVNLKGEPVKQTITAQQFWQTASGKRTGTGEFFAYDATNIRLREVSLGYKVPLSAKLPIKDIYISLVARNLFWIYRGSSILDIPGVGKRKLWFDPDISNGNGNDFAGVEYGALPSTRSIGLNLKLNF